MITSKNPYTGEVIEEFKEYTKEEINNAIKKADDRYKTWRKVSFSEKSKLLKNAAKE
ncbi:aldehyde dehydrogenase family protein, partial [Zunongwangia profunda]